MNVLRFQILRITVVAATLALAVVAGDAATHLGSPAGCTGNVLSALLGMRPPSSPLCSR